MLSSPHIDTRETTPLHDSKALPQTYVTLDRIIRSLSVDYRFGSPLDIPITSPALHSPANMPAASPASNVIAASPYHPHGEQRKAECFITRLE